MVRVGLFGAFEAEDALLAAVLRSELAARLPALELRVHTPMGADTSIGMTESVRWVDRALGVCDPIRQEELAATLDAVVIVGTVLCTATPVAQRLLVEGLGAFEPDVPVFWFGVSPVGDLVPVRDAIARRAAIWVSGHGAEDRLATFGVEAQGVPNPVIAVARLAPAEQVRPIAERLRMSNALPRDDFVGVDTGVTDVVANGAALPPVGVAPRWTPLERAAAVMASSLYVGASPTGSALATAYGRPSVWTGAPDDTPPFAVARGGGDLSAAIERARRHVPDAGALAGQVAALDAAFDQLAKLLETAEPAEGSTARALRVRLREEERATAERERALTEYAAALSNEIVSVGPRYTALWRKIHTGDRHYNWHRLRADRAEADVEKLWNLHERRVSMRLKRAIRSTKVGDAAARALGAGPLVPPPERSGGEGPDAPTA
jgi:hypothetical protein